jgi:hypothetical protein
MAIYNENSFQLWYRKHAKKLGINDDPDAPGHFYDYRTAYKEGAEPDEEGHWPSKYKRKGHSRYYVGREFDF